MRWQHLAVTMAMLAQPLLTAGAHAQNAQGQNGQGQNGQGAQNPAMNQVSGADLGRPPGIASGQSKLGAVYVDSRGLTLYAMSRRYANSRSAGFNGLKYCTGPCTQTWTALMAAADAKPIGNWIIVDGAQGPQWAYKGDPVFTYAADQSPGSTGGDGKDDLWRVMAYIPPVPTITAPAAVAPLFADGAYLLADNQGHALYTSDKDAAGGEPLLAGMASQGTGDWTVSRDGDQPQWAYRGKLVYVSQQTVPTQVPAEGTVLRP